MKKLIFNEKGEAIDEATGEVIGRKDSSGRLFLNPVGKTTEREQEPAKAEIIAEPEKKTEIKNPEPSSKEVKKPTVSIPTPPKYTKYEIRPDSEFTIEFCLEFSEDEKITILRKDAYLTTDGLERHWVKFRMWNFKEEMKWKNEATEFDSQIRFFRQNTEKLNELKLRNLIKDWSFAQEDPKFKLLHVNGVLSDESYEVLMGLHPTILDAIIILMNGRLE